MKPLLLFFIIRTLLGLTTTAEAQTIAGDSLNKKSDTIRKKETLKTTKRKPATNDTINPYQPAVPGKSIPYNSYRENKKLPDETPVGGLIKEIITNKKHN